jgi:hypothetical protein
MPMSEANESQYRLQAVLETAGNRILNEDFEVPAKPIK